MAREVAFGFDVRVRVNGSPAHTRGGGVVFNTDLPDTSSTETGTGRHRSKGQHEAELTLNIQADKNASPHAAPFNVGPRRTLALVEVFYFGADKDPYTFRNVECDRISGDWDTPNPNNMQAHGFTGDYDDPVTGEAME